MCVKIAPIGKNEYEKKWHLTNKRLTVKFSQGLDIAIWINIAD